MTTAVHPRFDTIEHHSDGAVTAYTYLPIDEVTMRRLADELFVTHWRLVVVGPCIEGAVFEIAFQTAPDVRYADGYLTVDLGAWHFHLCIGPHKGTSSSELRQKRPVARAALFERRGKGCAGGRSWGLRLWNGYGEQMTTVFLPNPRIGDDHQLLEVPDWSRLHTYYLLRAQFLGDAMPDDVAVTAQLPLSDDAPLVDGVSPE